MLSDAHGSRLNHDILSFLLSRQIQLFVTPPDTTGVTHFLDQLNKNIHQEHEKEKASLFTDFNTLNREAFMLILANILEKWVAKETLVNATRKVGVTAPQLSVDMIQKDKFERAADIMDQGDEEPSTSTTILSTPVSAISIVSPNKRCGSAQYWKEKFNQAMGIIDELHKKSIQLQENPDFVATQKVKPKLSNQQWYYQLQQQVCLRKK